MAAKKKAKGLALNRKYDTKYIGDEYDFTSIDFDAIDDADRKMMKIRAFNWYSYMYDIKKDFRESMVSYLKTMGWQPKRISGVLNNIKFEHFPAPVYSLIRMSQRGWKLDKDETKRINDTIQIMSSEAQKVKAEAKISTAEKPKSYASDHAILHSLEDEFEDILITEKKINVDYNLYDKIKSIGVPATILNKYVRPWIEARLVESKTQETIDQYGSTFAKKLTKVYTQLLTDLERALIVPKKPKVTRLKKPTPAVKQIRNLKYLKESAEYKLVSVNPETIVGASNLLTFNTKNRKLTWYTSGTGFTVSGSSLKNVQTAEEKTLRKPEEQLLSFLNTNAKTKLLKAFDSITTKVKADASPRMNDSTILVKVF